MGKYDKQIELLELLIENWHEIKDSLDFYFIFGHLYSGEVLHCYGLCDVCQLEDLPEKVIRDMFRSWKYFRGSYTYPVDGGYEFQNMRLITENPKRLHLSVHCLNYLKFHNKEFD